MQIMKLDLQDSKGGVFVVVANYEDAERIMLFIRRVNHLMAIAESAEESSRLAKEIMDERAKNPQ